MFVIPGTTSTFNGNFETAIRTGYVFVTDRNYQRLCEGSMVWKNGRLVSVSSDDKAVTPESQEQRAYKISKRNEIAACKHELYELDKKTMKFIDGDITAAQYEPFRLRKAALRSRIREIEAELGGV